MYPNLDKYNIYSRIIMAKPNFEIKTTLFHSIELFSKILLLCTQKTVGLNVTPEAPVLTWFMVFFIHYRKCWEIP
jgi:hypothetical protein